MRDVGRGLSSTDPATLPKFRKPPVVEVAISLQFSPLASFSSVHFGLFWERVRERYSLTEHQPPLPSVIELFGGQGAQQATLSLDRFPVGRCWYLSKDKSRLIQLQPDRFVLNWRKLATEIEYPSYDTLRNDFANELDSLLAFVKDYGLGSIEPTQTEVTYINHLYEKGTSVRSDLGRMLTVWSGRGSGEFLPPLEDTRLSWQYRFDKEGQPIGRLYAKVQPATRSSDNRPIYEFQLIARGAPRTADIPGAFALMDSGHEWIVRGFEALTTNEMHGLWERIQ